MMVNIINQADKLISSNIDYEFIISDSLEQLSIKIYYKKLTHTFHSYPLHSEKVYTCCNLKPILNYLGTLYIQNNIHTAKDRQGSSISQWVIKNITNFYMSSKKGQYKPPRLSPSNQSIKSSISSSFDIQQKSPQISESLITHKLNNKQSVSSIMLKQLPHETQSLTEKLLPNNKIPNDDQSATSSASRSKKNNSSKSRERTKIQRFKEFFFGQVQDCNRVIQFDGSIQPLNYHTNLVKNTKYNIITFIPKVLYNQFKFFFNMFFLLTALSQLIQILRVGLFITYIGPLLLVLSLTMAKEAYDDWNTYKRDIQANSKVYEVVKQSGLIKTKSKDLEIGDIVVLKKGDRIPADMLTLYSDNEQGTLFLKTDQLDGQTDWKLRKSIKKTQSMIISQLAEQNSSIQKSFGVLLDNELKVEIKQILIKSRAPNSEIYQFSGLFMFRDIKEKLTLQNTMWASTVLTNGTVIGLVIYIGRETRISMGSSTARTKNGIIDLEINFLSKLLFLLLVLMTILFILLQWTQPEYILIQSMRMIILLSSIIPISMRVNLDFAKLFYSYNINNDSLIEGSIARNSTIPEQLGRVRYILTDKTGTLTQNQMIFKRISIEDEIKFTDENQEEIKYMLQDYQEISSNIRSKQNSLKQIVTALALCHNVTPVFNQDNTEKQFQASSPDQITFVKIAQKFGLSILERTQTTMIISIPNHKKIEYEILYSFPFKSQTKRMGIILRKKQSPGQENENKKTEIVFYLKGADSVMRDFVQNRQKKGFIDEQCKDLSMTGLRTLVITKKNLTQEFYEDWSRRYEQEYNKLEIDQKQIEKLMFQLENNVEFLGITGIQDKLQQDLKDTIEALKSANIKIWMITGDKIQTAECISRSCGLQNVTQTNIKIEEATNSQLWKAKWQKVKQNLNRVLIIDGKTLAYVLQDKQRSKDFFLNAMKMPSVICCRCSPQQKRTLTQSVKSHKRKNQKSAVLGIGDGGNDVGMIQAADVGIGIVGKQGKQAALAADFSILKFKNVQALLLWHGRLSYKRSALLSSFIIHRGFIISVIQLIFSCVFFYVSIPAFNSYLSLGFATFFTFWPVFSLILDTDIDRVNAMKYPKLYDSLQSSNEMSTVNFMAWLWKAAFQGALIIILSLVLFMEESYLQVETICFTVLILTEYFMTLSEIHRIHVLTLACTGGSLLCYAICIVFLKNVVHVSSLSLVNFLFILLITLISWGPIFGWKLLRKKFRPTDYEKVMHTVKRKPIANHLFQDSFVGGSQKASIRKKSEKLKQIVQERESSFSKQEQEQDL